MVAKHDNISLDRIIFQIHWIQRRNLRPVFSLKEDIIQYVHHYHISTLPLNPDVTQNVGYCKCQRRDEEIKWMKTTSGCRDYNLAEARDQSIIPAPSSPTHHPHLHSKKIPWIEAVCVCPAASARNLHRCSVRKHRKPRPCPPAPLSTTRRGGRPASGSPNMVTTQLAEGFSPPTTKGREPPAVFICRVAGEVQLPVYTDA